MPKPAQLTPDEQRQLARLEAQVAAAVPHINAMIDAGKALQAIRDRQLYRASAATFDQYVEARFGMTRRRADQLVAFAGVSTVLEELGTAVPEISERAARPLAGMDADTIREVIQEAAGDPAGVTPATIRKAASRRKKARSAKAPRPWRERVPCAIVTVVLNRRAAGAGVDVEAALLSALEKYRQARGDQAGAAA